MDGLLYYGLSHLMCLDISERILEWKELDFKSLLPEIQR